MENILSRNGVLHSHIEEHCDCDLVHGDSYVWGADLQNVLTSVCNAYLLPFEEINQNVLLVQDRT